MDPQDSDPGDAPDVPVDKPPEKETPPVATAPPGTEHILEALNILPALIGADEEWVEKISAGVISKAKSDEESREGYMRRYANQQKLFAGEVKSFGYPAQGAKAPHIAIITKAILHSWALIYDQVMPAKGDYVKGVPLGPDDLARAQRVEKHMNWQLRYRIPDWVVSHQFTILGWLNGGSRFRYYSWDPIINCHSIKDMPIDDVIISYTETDQSPLMKSVERITLVLRLARWEMEAYQEKGFFSNLDEIFPDMKEGGESGDDDASGSTSSGESVPKYDDERSLVREAADKIQGLEPEKKPTKYAKRELYAQHTMIQFPKTFKIPELAGKTKPVIWTVDKQTKKPCSVVIREEPDPLDQERYNQEKAAHDQKTAAILQQHAQTPPPVDPDTGQEGPIPEPTLPKGPEPVQMKTVYRVLHYGLFPNTEGFYRYGLGFMLEGSNELANVLAGEFVLAAKFHNLKAGLMARGTQEKRGDLQLNYGKIIETMLEPEQLDKAIKILDFGPPSPALMEAVDRLEANSEITAAASVLSGAQGSSNETKGGMQIRNSNAMNLVSVMTRIYLEVLKAELRLIAHGNSIYLPDEEAFPIISLIPGPNGQPTVEPGSVLRTDYIEDVHLEFTADARMISKPERIQNAKESLDLILNSPAAENVQLVDFALRKYFEVSEGFDYVAKMGPPPQPPPPPSPESQDTENAGFFNEKDHPVLPDDNHVEHLKHIDQLKLSPLHEHMSQTGKQLLDRHQRAHMAQFYLQLQALQQQTGIPIHELAKQVGLGRVAPRPDDTGPEAALGGTAPNGAPPPPGPGTGPPT